MGGFWSSPTLPPELHVVVVGGGYGGINAGLELLRVKANFTLISPRDCFHHNVGALRATVQPDFIKKTLIPLETTFGAHFKQGLVVDIKPGQKKVVLASGEEVQYDVLILATGSSGQFPVKFAETTNAEEAEKMYREVNDKIRASHSVVVIGGGATGTELAVELAVEFPEKDVTLVHSRDELIAPGFTDKFQSKLRGILDRYHVQYKLGEKVENLAAIENMSSATVKTDKGTVIEADIVFKTVGLPINPAAYKRALGSKMEENGQLRVDQFLRVDGCEDIYAIGDCCNTKDFKLAYAAGEQAKRVVSNLVQRANGKAEQPWVEGTLPLKLILALGPAAGLGESAGGWIVPEWACVWFKSGDGMSTRFWGMMQQPMPS